MPSYPYDVVAPLIRSHDRISLQLEITSSFIMSSRVLKKLGLEKDDDISTLDVLIEKKIANGCNLNHSKEKHNKYDLVCIGNTLAYDHVISVYYASIYMTIH